MPEYSLAVIAGDGIGPEVIAEGRKALDAVAIQSDGLFLPRHRISLGQRLLPGNRTHDARGRPGSPLRL